MESDGDGDTNDDEESDGGGDDGPGSVMEWLCELVKGGMDEVICGSRLGADDHHAIIDEGGGEVVMTFSDRSFKQDASDGESVAAVGFTLCKVDKGVERAVGRMSTPHA